MALQLLVNPINLNNAKSLIKLGVHKLFIGIKDFSIYCECCLTINEIEILLKQKNKTKIYININKYFFEHEIIELQKLLFSLIKLPIDGIIFSDFAIPQILYENRLKTYLIYNPETLVTNYGQFVFYLNNVINEVCLARELNKNEIEEIAKQKKKTKIQIPVCGYSFIMQSKWKLLSTFAKVNKIKENLTNKKLYIKEENRHYPMIIREDKNGTYVHSNYDLDLIENVTDFKKMDIDTIRIDSYLHDEKWVIEKATKYLDAINNDSKFNAKSIFSNGFYKNSKDIIYLKGNGNE